MTVRQEPYMNIDDMAAHKNGDETSGSPPGGWLQCRS